MSRTNVDFSKHEFTILKSDHFNTYQLKKPDTIHQMVKFTNIDNVLLVTGDLGNWVFARSFIPSEDGSVSDGYWLEKLAIHSIQDGQQFSSDLTEKELQRMINGGASEYGYSGEELEIATEYYKNCLAHVHDDEIDYIQEMRNFPKFMCGEEMIFLKETKPWLNFVFDAFDNMCNRLKHKESVTINHL